jgi:glycosyltransferase involved in cell wall biosynthesis
MQDVCLVVPCYNEAGRLDANSFADALASNPRLALCFVDDGSRDQTLQVLQALATRAPERIAVLSLEHNSGKAAAVRHGMLQAATDSRYAFIGYWDADLSTPLSELARFLDTFDRSPEAVAVIGSRLKRLGADIDRRAVRHALGRVFATLASLAVDLPVYDSQCGAKLFRATAIQWLCAEAFLSRWCFDVEILARIAARLGNQQTTRAVVEVPLSAWREVGGSKLGAAQMAGMARDLLRIRRRYPRRG